MSEVNWLTVYSAVLPELVACVCNGTISLPGRKWLRIVGESISVAIAIGFV